MFLAIVRRVDEKRTPTNEIRKAYVEKDASVVARYLAEGEPIEFYEISVTAENVTLKKASLKEGPRATVEREVIELEVGGAVVGRAEIVA